MKITHFTATVLAGLSLLMSSCVVEPGYYGSGTVTYSTNSAWVSASYDSAGFPIYGYYYGRPVYGYTAAGAAIFSIAALTAWCYVPNWRPAPWYHGPHHHPHHVHHAPKPPKCDHGHKPGVRPSGGLHAPVHTRPESVLGKPSRPVSRPSTVSRPTTRPSTSSSRPVSRPSTVSRPTTRPSTSSSRPVSRPSTVSRPTTRPSTSSSRPVSRPASVSRTGSRR